MAIDPVSVGGIAKVIGTHVATWVRNLSRAKAARKQESLLALSKVIAALRMTQAYSRGLSQGHQNHSTEADIAVKWTEVGFELERLGLASLAKKCDIKGRYWADPNQFDEEFLLQAKTDLASVEKLARELQTKIKLGGNQ
ncbi:MAG: hypothetical protein IPP44_00410 [Ideonella sp.]|nr:hypothetical protein [Ideonella sp.]